MKDLITKYNHLFQGIGRIEDKRNGREILSRFHMKPGAVPVAQKPRQVPYYLQEPLKKWLDLGIQEDILMNQLPGAPIWWCNRNQGLRSGHLEQHTIRVSVDLRVPNQYMERSRISQAPIVEDFIHKFHDCTIWTKLDLRSTPRIKIATFSTTWILLDLKGL